MTQLSLENFLTICGLFSLGFGGWMMRIERIMSDYCRRLTREETKSDIYHPDGTKIQ